MGADHTASIEKLKRLNGKLHFKRGNHDSPSKFNHYLNLDSVDKNVELFNIWSDQLKFGKWLFHISHHPTILSDFEFINPGHKHFCLHGHTHSKDRFQFLQYCCYNIALDAHNNRPVNLTEIQDDLRQKMAELFEKRRSGE
jgi:calcineurin-like phosphoesterase family protein